MEKIYNMEEIMEVLDVKTRQTISRYVREGKLPARLRGGKVVAFQSDIDQYFENCKIKVKGKP